MINLDHHLPAIAFDAKGRMRRLERALQRISRIALMPQAVSERQVLVSIHDTAEDALCGLPVDHERTALSNLRVPDSSVSD